MSAATSDSPVKDVPVKNILPPTIIKEKIVYPSKKGITNNMLIEIICEEIAFQLDKNPEYKFYKLGMKLENKDGSVTYPFQLIRKDL